MKYEMRRLVPKDAKTITEIAIWVITDPESSEHLAAIHDDDRRAAIVMFLDPGEERSFTMESAAALGMFPFDEVQKALETYEPGKSFCVILVKRHKVAVTVVGKT